MTERQSSRVHERWARLRFSVIGPLLAAPPTRGTLRGEIEKLAAREWRHPSTGEPVRFGASTIERWFYRAVKERHDPVGVLRRKVRTDAEQQASMNDTVRQALLAQYAAHKSWSFQLHHDNLVALGDKRPELRPLPSYSTLRRFLKAHGIEKRRRLTSRRTEGAERAEARLFDREVRSYEAEYVGGVLHWDCHVGSKKVLTPRGEWQTQLRLTKGVKRAIERAMGERDWQDAGVRWQGKDGRLRLEGWSRHRRIVILRPSAPWR